MAKGARRKLQTTSGKVDENIENGQAPGRCHAVHGLPVGEILEGVRCFQLDTIERLGPEKNIDRVKQMVASMEEQRFADDYTSRQRNAPSTAVCCLLRSERNKA